MIIEMSTILRVGLIVITLLSIIFVVKIITLKLTSRKE